MSRIPTPTTVEDAPEASRPLLEAVKKQLGSVPNMFRLVSQSPAALEGYLALNGAWARAPPRRHRERIALAVPRSTAAATACPPTATSARPSRISTTPRSRQPRRRLNGPEGRGRRAFAVRSPASAAMSRRRPRARKPPATPTRRRSRWSCTSPSTRGPTTSTRSSRPTSTSPSSWPKRPDGPSSNQYRLREGTSS